MNSLPNPNKFKGRWLYVPVAIEADLSDLPGYANLEESDPYESYIEVIFEIEGPAGAHFWRVVGSREV